MLENQFIRFFNTIDAAKAADPLKVVVGQRSTGIFFEGMADSIAALTYSDLEEVTEDPLQADDDVNFENLFGFGHALQNLLSEDEGFCFIIHLSFNGGSHRYSNPLIMTKSAEGMAFIQYRCDQDAFGFPFTTISESAALYLPINIKNPQLSQDDKTYVKTSGEVVVLFSKYFKEWEAESEYLTEEMHDRICAALCCDYVYLDGVRLTKSDSYQIDWENTYKKACGQKLAKATWKMRANVTSRNSNC